MYDTKLHVGDCILLSGDHFIAKGIEMFTNSEWSHVGIYVGGGDQKVINSMISGVAISSFSNFIKNSTKICIRRIPNLTVDAAERMKAKAYSLIYENYDYIQFASLAAYNLLRKIGLRLPWLIYNSRTSMICSELYAVCALTIPLTFAKHIKAVVPEVLYTTDKMVTYDEKKLG